MPMQFTVTYRSRTGTVESEVVEASSRAELFDLFQRRGLTPLKVIEGAKTAKRMPPGADSQKRRRSLKACWLILGAGAILGVGIWLWKRTPETEVEKDVSLTKKSAPIAVVQPSAPPKPLAMPTNAPPSPKKLRKWEYPASRTNELSAAELRKWKVMHRPPPGYTNDTSRTEPPPKYAIFKHNSENEIASLLTMTPGETLVGTPHYTKKLTEDFLKSLETPIVVSEEDSPENAELKRVMIETKIELKQRLDAGEDLGQILLDTRSQYQDLARYKMTLEQELSTLRRNPDVSMQDIEDFMTAANQLLEQKGIAPLKLSPISRRMLMRKKGKK